MPLLSNVVIFFISIAVLTPNGQFLDYANIAFRKQYIVSVYEVSHRLINATAIAMTLLFPAKTYKDLILRCKYT